MDKDFALLRNFSSKTSCRTKVIGARRFRPLLEKYREMTGFVETEPNAIMHHRIALYGPPCPRCAKPLRSPQAAFCAECGHRVD